MIASALALLAALFLACLLSFRETSTSPPGMSVSSSLALFLPRPLLLLVVSSGKEF